tara:strand:- start:625 stop:867 length:243 start_codon:yes stop_codon:yes gene_type:complete
MEKPVKEDYDFNNLFESLAYIKEQELYIEYLKGMLSKTLPHLEKVDRANKSTTLQGVITFFMMASVVALVIILTVIVINI